MVNNNSAGSAREDFASGIVNASSDAEDLHLIADAIGNPGGPMAIIALGEPPLVNPELAPRSQIDFCGWVYENYNRIFGRKVSPIGCKPIKTAKVEGLNVFACEAYGGQYYGAWSRFDGRFIGWMWYSPKLSQMDHQFAVGRVTQVSVFEDMHDYTIRKAPVKTFTDALKYAVQFMKVV